MTLKASKIPENRRFLITILDYNEQSRNLFSFNFFCRCRSRNRLSYLRKTCSTYETTVENTSEHPLIYDDSNFVNGIRTQPRIPVAHVNSYQLENRNDRLLTQVHISWRHLRFVPSSNRFNMHSFLNYGLNIQFLAENAGWIWLCCALSLVLPFFHLYL